MWSTMVNFDFQFSHFTSQIEPYFQFQKLAGKSWRFGKRLKIYIPLERRVLLKTYNWNNSAN